MAKKVVATLKAKEKAVSITKVIRAVKNPKTGAYSFKEDIMPTERVEAFLKENK
ncbi:MAG: DUF4295 domain-containing protein [Bacteroidia bacterium]|nr:DUF4295 domain-containing protein [Bacteroidia bacterium]MDW8158005.1 DUF4295 domain-containing protein [Bacteroidia bacterium]